MQLLLLLNALLAMTDYSIAFGEGYISGYAIHKELKSLNATCPPYDTCEDGRTSDSLDFSVCQCTTACVRLGTCCRDSYFYGNKASTTMPTCTSVNGERGYFMVDRCPPNQDSVWKDLCEEEWDGEDDVLRLLPVTSLFTLITYRNYYCLRCHEKTDDFQYWDLELGSYDYEFDPSIDRSNVSVTYVGQQQTWMAPLGTGGATIPVFLYIQPSEQVSGLRVFCDWDVISRCSDTWTDKDVGDKCEAYMGIVYIKKGDQFVKYRNAHCALCNNEDLSDMHCRSSDTPVGVVGGSKVPFSFTHLLDVNRSDGDKVGKIQKCGANFMWDPIRKTCREVKCALPGHVVREGKCTRP